MTKYAVYYDDGYHAYQLEVFTSKDEAEKFFIAEVNKFKADPVKYTEMTPDEYHPDGPPDLELAEVDEDDDCYLNTLNCWNLDGGFDVDP